MSPHRKLPTVEGERRYPPDGIYTGGFGEDDREMWRVCTCTVNCPLPCKFACDCEACAASYNDFLSEE